MKGRKKIEGKKKELDRKMTNRRRMKMERREVRCTRMSMIRT